MIAALETAASGVAGQFVGLRAFLDLTRDRLAAGDVAAAVEELCRILNILRAAVGEDKWRQEVVPLCLAHPLRELLHQDPYTHRAFAKPRGYAGDAIMLDFLYDGVAPPGATPLGRAIFAATTRSPNGRSVVDRRDRLAGLIDAVAAATPRPRILSVACGHLREAQRSRAVREGRVGDFFALDQDAASLAVVEREQAGRGVTPVHAAVKDLLRGRVAFPSLDLIYAAGLYDYLSESLAARLTATLFGMLAPGGRLLVGNFAPGCHGRGYMEAFMDWQLLYRDEGKLARLLEAVPKQLVTATTIFGDTEGNVAYLEMQRC